MKLNDMKRIVVMLLAGLPMCLLAQVSPYVNRVYEFCPAPGQFVHELPEVNPEDSQDDVLNKVEEAIVGKANGSLVSLGAWGGYIVVGFDHPVQNVEGEYDLKIYGNAMSNASEPGVVMVARDDNGNGLPDDTWYELHGSVHTDAKTKRHYTVTYYRPEVNHKPQPHPTQNLITDVKYIRWRDSEGQSGYLEKNTFHTQEYFPSWQHADSLVFEGTRLPDNAIDQNGNGSFFLMTPYDWGYADNQPNGKDASCVDIGWAVDDNGNGVDLHEVHFVKIYTGVFQSNGWTGECSTELSGVVDLHALASNLDENSQDIPIIYNKDELFITLQSEAHLSLYDMWGNPVLQKSLLAGEHYLQLPKALKGIFVFRLQNCGGLVLKKKLCLF